MESDGYGVCVYSDGRRYEGEWKNGKHHGKGKMIYSPGNVYEGEWKDGMKHGRGKMISIYNTYEHKYRHDNAVEYIGSKYEEVR